MYRTLFELAALVMVGWLPLIFLPTWRFSRRLAETAVFAAWVAALYLVGIAAVLAELGPGIMADFGSADGVLALLQNEGLALVAWIHILAFDHVVGVLIYRDNMRHRFVPLPVQSALLFLTFMFGPVGFLTYWAARMSRGRAGWTAWGEPEPAAARVHGPAEPGGGEPARVHVPLRRGSRFADVVTSSSPVAALVSLIRREPVVVALGLGGIVLAGLCAVLAALNGGWFVPPEGRLADAFRFELGSGIYILTLAILLPLAGFTERGRRRWVRGFVAMGVYFLAIEVVQAARGIDPRFTQAGSGLDQAAGALFGITALLMIAFSAILLGRFFRNDVLIDRPALRTAIRYGVAGIALSFAVGLAMSALRSRITGDAGSLMPLHAAGLHGIQAVPLVVLLAHAAGHGPALRRRVAHAAGAAWIALCLGLLAQALAGLPPTAPSAWNGVVLAAVLAFALTGGVAGAGWVRLRLTGSGVVGGD